MSPPRVSVVMPVRDEERFVEDAVRSVLDQTFGDLELVAVDDGSSDRTRPILERLAAADARVRIVDGAGAGVAAALNRGIDAALGEYVARMDADDVSLPNRLERQVAVLDARPELGVLGSHVRYIDTDANAVGEWRLPIGSRLVRWWLLFETPVAHPAAVIRRSTLAGDRYSTSTPHAEDYDLWARLARRTEIDNLDETLLARRVHGASISDRNTSLQEETVVAIATRVAADLLGRSPRLSDVAALRRSTTGAGLSVREAARAARLLVSLALAQGRHDGFRPIAGDTLRRLRRVAAAAVRVRSTV